MRGADVASTATERTDGEAISEVARLRVKLADGDRLCERSAHLCFVLRLDPDEYRVRITGLESFLSRSHDRTVQTITMRQRRGRQQ